MMVNSEGNKNLYENSTSKELYKKREKEYIKQNINKDEDIKTPEIKKIDFGKSNILIRETYIDENGHERDREKTIEISAFSERKRKETDKMNKNFELPEDKG